MDKVSVFVVLAQIFSADCGVLIWSPTQLYVPALKSFGQDEFNGVLDRLNRPNVVAFRTEPDKLLDVIPRNLENLYSSYVPNSNLEFDGATELTNDIQENLHMIKDKINKFLKDDNYDNLLLVLTFNNKRTKREDNEDNNAKEIVQSDDYKGPVIYDAEGTALLYSSRPPILRIDNLTIVLPPSKIVTKDQRDGYTRLMPTIVFEDGVKIILRFKFPSSGGYWSMTSVEILYQTKDDNKSFNLVITGEIGAPNHFSYHCHKDTVFRDPSGNVNLTIYQIQVQPDAKNDRFSDAYDCVDFTTGPIWSGVLISLTLIFGLLVAFSALGNIKTMDKFDNHKTKQLNITVSE